MERYVDASDLASYSFCSRAWHIAQINVASPEAEPEREAGLAWHAAHPERVATAKQSKKLARAFGIALLLIPLMLLYRIVPRDRPPLTGCCRVYWMAVFQPEREYRSTGRYGRLR
jgi:hypothetical protein